MVEIFSRYITVFLHPITSHNYFRYSRWQLSEDTIQPLSFEETVSVSWIFVIIKAFYTLIFINAGLKISLLGDNTVYFLTIAEIILFPLIAFLYAKFWESLIGTFVEFYGFKEGSIDKPISEIVNLSICSNTFLLVPLLGNTLRFFSALFFLFVGLKNNLHFSNLQSLLIICSPLFVLMFIAAIALVGALIFFTDLSSAIGLLN